jgi:ketosteroid isomerase-like protein
VTVSSSNAELAREGFEAVARGDFAAVAELLAPDVAWHGGDRLADGACRNREQVLAFMRRAQRQAGIGELVDVVDLGDQVVVVLRPVSDGRGEAELRANLTTFRDGKVVEMVAYESPAAALDAAAGRR